MGLTMSLRASGAGRRVFTRRLWPQGLAMIGVLGVLPPAEARVVRFEVVEVQSPTANGQSFGDVGPYERISGKVHGEVDPGDPKNALITDIEHAPRNARGMVEYVATFSLVKPIDMSKASGVLMYSVVNRGNGAATPGPAGHVSVVSGWQGDVVPTATNQTLQVPVARNADGSSITGPFVTRMTGRSGASVPILIPRGQPSPYPPVTLDTTRASLISATSETATGMKSGATAISGADWAFADCASVPFPGTPHPGHLCLKNGFDPSLLYELRYTVKDPLVLGLGLAATRDLNSFLRYETKDDLGTPNPIADTIRWAISEGTSQSGTFLKLSILLGFNQDEAGRIVWDGSNPNIAARVTDLNRRFALPGGLVGLFELGHEAATWWESWGDAARGRPPAGILDRCRATSTCPKIMETFGAAEIWGLRHSFVLVGTDAAADLPLPANVRRYYFPGTNHGGGPGGFSRTTAPVDGCVLPSNPAPTAPMRAALLEALTAWVTAGTPMPPSRYPRIADGTLVRPTREAMGFPAIPGQPSPEGLVYPLIDYDVGTSFRYAEASGVPTHVGTVKQVLPQLVPRVDADGNEVAGIKSPLQSAPLGTYTGWNVLSSGVFTGQMCIFTSPVGGFIPFARTRAERMALNDPRLSLEERYQDHAGYVQAVTGATEALVREGYLRPEAGAAMIAQAEASDVLR
jgi:hypothetical protein